MKFLVRLFHKDNKDQVVEATHPQQVAALKQQGFEEVADSDKNKKENK